jgi:hypothetical protein
MMSDDFTLGPVGGTVGVAGVCARKRIGVVVDNNVLPPVLFLIDVIWVEEVGISAFNRIGLDVDKPCPQRLSVVLLTSKLL